MIHTPQNLPQFGRRVGASNLLTRDIDTLMKGAPGHSMFERITAVAEKADADIVARLEVLRRGLACIKEPHPKQGIISRELAHYLMVLPPGDLGAQLEDIAMNMSLPLRVREGAYMRMFILYMGRLKRQQKKGRFL